ncbi:transcription termination factor 1a, mitochondrial [Corythoichthys intestinalis]|uniref:transcription termination factor 1a, mitochondrial n=1 Tax=Corythoichthys intestinalis TaxID=161448 RepID=UPI0025A51229|nr:transcription termination factor 1a, mitochondrial [Corythoichthys intestinalis]XP_061808452.1 transcription termination factor 1a, mitochondrial-like [Nerophis lumbriciformis]
MASVCKALIGLHRCFILQQPFKCLTVKSITTRPLWRSYSVASDDDDPKTTLNPENESLLENLNLMGVDVKMARKRQPGVLRRLFTNEEAVALFLKRKGASSQTVASIISRYPRAITRSLEHLEQRWQLWRNIFQNDLAIVAILDRSPESFFRSSDNRNLEKNIDFLSSLGLSNKDLHRMFATAPRTFSNSLELNRQMVDFLEDVCYELGGTDPERFAKTIISRNLYILIRSTKRVKANVDFLKVSLKLSDAELLELLQGSGAKILDLSNEYIKKNMASLQGRLLMLGCGEEDVRKLITASPMVLYIGATTLRTKLDCLLKGGITAKQILEKPKVLDTSTQSVNARLEELQQIGYDFESNGIGILGLSQKRFAAKKEKLLPSKNK